MAVRLFRSLDTGLGSSWECFRAANGAYVVVPIRRWCLANFPVAWERRHCGVFGWEGGRGEVRIKERRECLTVTGAVHPVTGFFVLRTAFPKVWNTIPPGLKGRTIGYY